MPSASTSSSNGTKRPTASEKALQDSLHDLISKLTAAIDHIKNWPEGKSSDVHMDNTRRLIEKINLILQALKKVENTVKNDDTSTESQLYLSLKDTPIPLDLLDLMDHGGGLHPEYFIRGLGQEALRQLAGLRQRKEALQMLGNAVQVGIAKKKKKRQERAAVAGETEPAAKRQRTA